MKPNMLLLMLLCVITGHAAASSPTNIAFSSRKATIFGAKYHVYTIRCSDGSQQKISAWDNKTKWCQGMRNKQCFPSQIKAASAVCR